MGTYIQTDTMLDSTDNQISRRTHARRAIIATAGATAARASGAHEGGCLLPASSHQLYQEAETLPGFVNDGGDRAIDQAELENLEISGAATVWHGIGTSSLIFGLIGLSVFLFITTIISCIGCCMGRGAPVQGSGDTTTQ